MPSHGSGKPSLAPLTTDIARSRSNSSTSPHSRSPIASPTPVAGPNANGGSSSDIIIATSPAQSTSSTSRFHEAFTARHAQQSSVSSIESDASYAAESRTSDDDDDERDAEGDDDAGAGMDQSLDTAGTLKGKQRARADVKEDDVDDDEDKDSSFATLRQQLSSSPPISFRDFAYSNETAVTVDQQQAPSPERRSSELDLNRLLSSFGGRPASIDLSGSGFAGEDENEEHENELGLRSRAGSGSRDRSRDRTYPAPLYLQGDKATITPLNIPKRPAKASQPATPASDQPIPPLPTSAGSSTPSSLSKDDLAKSLNPLSLSQNSRNQKRSSIMYNVSPSASTHVSPNTSMSRASSSSHIPPDVTPIGPQALMLYIMSLRSASVPMSVSQSHGPPSRSGTPVSSQVHQRGRSAGTSETTETESDSHHGAKLDVVDLSQKKIAELPVEVIEELKDEVEKLALGYNFLRELPPSFKSLGRTLKYLNVRVNYFSVFPPMLCEMPALEILDISRNKIKKLPATPGTLVNLKVFSFAKNRVRRLPNWLGRMPQLKMLKLDHNPLEWPPKEILQLPSSSGTADKDSSKKSVHESDDLRQWLTDLMRYIRDHPDRTAGSSERRPRAYSTANEASDDEDLTATIGNSSATSALPRSESGRSLASLSSHSRTRTPTNIFQKAALSNSTLSSSPAHLKNLEDARSAAHSRNASLSPRQIVASPIEDTKLMLRSKKSLPDLRQSHAEILAERNAGHPAMPESNSGLTSKASQLFMKIVKQPSSTLLRSTAATLSEAGLTTKDANDNPLTTLRPSGLRQQSGSSSSKSPFFRVPGTPPSTAAKVEFSSPSNRSKQGDLDSSPAGFDRNSGAYFRRLSMLPASTISKAVSPTLLAFADSIRGILFALSQIYTALRQFVVFASQDRLPARLARLMGTADGSMSLLINALDRFDSLSRRGTPDMQIVEDIFKHCRDNVSVFHKLVTALSPELKSLTGTADVRYTRTLLLMMYGAMGEIAHSWNSVAPLLSEISAQNDGVSLQAIITGAIDGDDDATEDGRQQAPLRMATGPNGAMLVRTRSRTRRHAGSFSVEDVQLGAVLPPAAPVPAMPPLDQVRLHRKASSHSLSMSSDGPPPFDMSAVKLRPAKMPSSAARKGLNAQLALPEPQFAPGDVAMKAFDQPLTPGVSMFENGNPLAAASAKSASESSSQGSNATSPPVSAIPLSAAVPAPTLPRSDTSRSVSKSTTSTTPTSTTVTPAQKAQNDEAFLAMVESTSSIAFDIYGLVLDSIEAGETIANDARRAKEVTDLCIIGNETTTKLKGAWDRVRGPDGRALSFSPSDAKKLGDQAYLFVQTVIRFAKLVKAISLEQPFPSRLREGVGQLTIATREFARTLSHTQTSFRPTISSSSSTNASGTKDKSKKTLA